MSCVSSQNFKSLYYIQPLIQCFDLGRFDVEKPVYHPLEKLKILVDKCTSIFQVEIKRMLNRKSTKHVFIAS